MMVLMFIVITFVSNALCMYDGPIYLKYLKYKIQKYFLVYFFLNFIFFSF